MKKEPREVPVRILLESPPSGIDFAVQFGKGGPNGIHHKQRSTGEDLAFSFSISLKSDDLSPDFGSAYVQGPRDGRFIYLVVGTMAGQEDSPWTRRIKVPLAGITTLQVKQVIEKPKKVLQARIPGTGKDGGPSCATCRPIDGWEVL
jgi:hypothetical protein